MCPWYRRIRATCVVVLVLALTLRLTGSTRLQISQETKLEFASFLLYLETGRIVHPGTELPQIVTWMPNAAQPADSHQQTALPKPTEVVQKPQLTFSAADAGALGVKYGGEYRPDLGALLSAPVELDFSGDDPRILIIHTHATESYTQEDGWRYNASGNYRTLDENFNMLRVGEKMAEILNGQGIPTLHDRTLHDYPSYNGSYSNALETIKDYLERYPTIEMVIDVHRDALETDDGRQLSTHTTVNGQSSAQIMLVVGTDEGGLNHPDWQDNLSWALKLQCRMDALYPGLARKLSLREERFNAHLTAGSILVEVGTAGDTLADALAAAESFTWVVAKTIVDMGLDQP